MFGQVELFVLRHNSQKLACPVHLHDTAAVGRRLNLFLLRACTTRCLGWALGNKFPVVIADSQLTPGKLFASKQTLALSACVFSGLYYVILSASVLRLAMEGEALARVQQPDRPIFSPLASR
jgi:hypothetical protein